MVVEHVAHEESDTSHVVEAHPRPGIEIDPQLVGMIEVVRAHRMWIQVDASEVDDPQQLRGVAHDDLARGPARWKAQLHRLDPVRMLLGRSLLKERLTPSAVHVTLEYERATGDSSQRAACNRGVVFRQVELRVAGLRKEDLVRVGDRHLAARGFQHGLLRLCHPRVRIFSAG
jgi:hypothetical protein